ncbi:Protein slender lobes [Lucilia cuprina]|uniref:Protein slender lobes n=1 Tax=Lucilia cuprina TaxID=7375 RepID=A0A0L0CE59_LUCCU|nr:Protein slender lobes [Lucilia cuprina]
MDTSVTDSASRVTRSLRKRITSVDSDNSSRPGTPVPSKLISISEITASPSRSTRMTRRNSTSGVATPVKTPAKRITASSAVIPENTETITPARRSTRRRSVSVQESDEPSQTGLKIPSFAALDEEKIDSNVQKSSRVTRSQSKSPQQIKSSNNASTTSPKETNENKNKESEDQIMKTNNQKRRKPGPRSKTGENEDVSDVEISVLENQIQEEIKNKSPNITTIILTDDESNAQKDEIQQDTETVASEKNDFQVSDAETVESTNFKLQIDSNSNDSITNLHDTEKSTNLKDDNTANIKSSEELNVVKSGQNESEESISSSINEKTNIAEEHMDDKQNVNVKAENMSEDNLQENEINSSVGKIVELKDDSVKDCTTPQTKVGISSNDKVEILSVSTLTPYRGKDSNVSDCKVISKKVEFVSSPTNDMTIKNIYPKTPASTKTANSFIEVNSSHDGSFQAEKNTLDTHSDDNQVETPKKDDNKEITINSDEVKNKELEMQAQIESKTTPICAFKCIRPLEIVQSSTPINTDASKSEEEQVHSSKSKNTPLKEEITEDSKSETHTTDVEPSSNQNNNEIKWVNPSVKGTTVEGCKLDAVVTRNDANANECRDNADSFVEQVKTNKKKSIIFLSEDEDDEENYQDDKNEDDDECELAPGEKPYKQKHEFHDDEAMEVDDYASGDSMDSEERKEIEDNEIPIDGESIGSHTTDDEHDEYADEEEDSENADSFIVSDNEELECSESNNEDELVDEDTREHNRKKKKTYKRLQRPAESSSSSDEEVETIQEESKENLKGKCISQLDEENRTEENVNEEYAVKSVSNSGEFFIETNNIHNKSSENAILDSSKLSDSALRLQCTAESESDVEEEIEEKLSFSRKEILRKLNQSDRFNKSVRDLNPESDTSPVELDVQAEIPGFKQDNNNEKSESSDEEHTTLSTPDNKKHDSSKFKSESHLGEVSVTSESDADKENEHKSMILAPRRKTDSGLSVSFGNFKKPKSSKGRQEWQRSFTIDVTVKGGDLETAVTDVKLKEETVSPTSSSTDDQKDEEIEGEDLSNLEIIKHMPLQLGNPLIRTRRQSLALPTNPDMEICSSSHGGGTNKILKRKSLGILSSSEFNPSQSFIDSIELQKSELNRQVAKRKRLSKSFCGAAETLDNSIVDIDVRHLHKRSKLIGENSMAESHHESIENINTSKLSTKICSTPHQKADKNDSNNNIQRILNRCDEILEAANQAKLEAKINNKKNKRKLPKKLRKKTGSNLPKELNPENALRKVSNDIKRKDKTKTALSQAIKAADVILGKKKQSQHNTKEQDETESKKLSPDVLEAIQKSALMKKNCKKGITTNVHTTLTSAGNFMEMPHTPEKKKKKPTYIQLPTGKVSVEPATPKKRSVLAFNGTEFRESPITPYAVGFKVRQIPRSGSNDSTLSVLKNGKRKRDHDKLPKEHVFPKSQWTQSGLFIEEDIPKNRKTARSENQELAINRNFKENAIMRPDIKRNTKREMLILKDRRQKHGYY